MSELVDLSKLDAPKVLEDLDFETLLAERKQEFINLFEESERPFWQSRLSLESEPITKLLQITRRHHQSQQSMKMMRSYD